MRHNLRPVNADDERFFLRVAIYFNAAFRVEQKAFQNCEVGLEMSNIALIYNEEKQTLLCAWPHF